MTEISSIPSLVTVLMALGIGLGVVSLAFWVFYAATAPIGTGLSNLRRFAAGSRKGSALLLISSALLWALLASPALFLAIIFYCTVAVVAISSIMLATFLLVSTRQQ